MRIRYDRKVYALYIRLREGEAEERRGLRRRRDDYDNAGLLMSIEILDASRVLGGREMKVELALTETSPERWAFSPPRALGFDAPQSLEGLRHEALRSTCFACTLSCVSKSSGFCSDHAGNAPME